MKRAEEFRHRKPGEADPLEDYQVHTFDPELLQFGVELKEAVSLYRSRSLDTTATLLETAQRCTEYMSRTPHLKIDPSNTNLWSAISELVSAVSTTPIDQPSLSRAVYNFDLICPYDRQESSKGFSSSDALATDEDMRSIEHHVPPIGEHHDTTEGA